MRRLVLALLAAAVPLSAQSPADTAVADTVRVRRGSEVLIPIGSVFLPGLGQYIHGETKVGLVYSSLAIAGIVAEGAVSYEGDFPRDSDDQLAEAISDVGFSASFLGAWDAFHRGIPAMRRQGRYQFLPRRRESVGSLLSAPFDVRFLRRWTTWVDLAQTALVTGLILSEREPATPYVPYRGNDAAFAASSAMNAAIAEEAFFRGYLLPMLHERTGRRFWVANGTQAAVFGALHLPGGAGPFAAYIGTWGLWEGWVVKRNDWSVRESVFHHFWYDAAIFTAAMLVEERSSATPMRLGFPTIRF